MSEYIFGFLVGAITMYLALKPQIKELNKLVSMTAETNQAVRELKADCKKR